MFPPRVENSRRTMSHAIFHALFENFPSRKKILSFSQTYLVLLCVCWSALKTTKDCGLPLFFPYFKHTSVCWNFSLHTHTHERDSLLRGCSSLDCCSMNASGCGVGGGIYKKREKRGSERVRMRERENVPDGSGGAGMPDRRERSD